MFGGAIAGLVLFLSLKLEGVHASRVGVHTKRHQYRDSINDVLSHESIVWLDLYPFKLPIITTSGSSGLSTL